VRVRGDADARLLPFPSVTFSDVTVGDEAQPVMTIDRFSMDAELAPFLSGEVLIFDMRVEAPKAVVRILEDGRLDWALKRRPTPPGDLVVLEKVTIENADITIVDEQNVRTHEIRDINALISAKSLAGPWTIDAEGEIAGQRGGVSISTGIAQADGSIRMRVRAVPDSWPVLLETEGQARIDNNKPLYDGLFTFMGMSRTETDNTAPERPLIVAKGDFAATNERLSIAEWRAEIGLSDDPYVVTGQATIDTGPNPEFLLVADGQQIDMDRLGGEEPAPEDIASLSLEQRLAVVNQFIDRLPPPPLPGRVSLNLPAIIAGDTTLRQISLDARPDGDAWLIDGFSANLPGRTTVEARGRLASGAQASFEGMLTIASTQPSGLANWLVGDVDPVIRQLGAAGFSAQVSLSPALQRFEALEVAIGPAILKGRLERQMPASGTPSLSVELAGDTFDVDAVRALALLAGGNSGATRPLAQYNLAARIEADTFTLGDYRLDGFETSLVWRDGLLTLDSLNFDDFGGASGSFSASLEGSVAAPRGTVKGAFSAETAARLFDLADQATGGHQIIRRLAANRAAFDGVLADVTLVLDPEAGPELTVEGISGGSSVRFRAAGTGFMPGGDGPRTIAIEAENPEAYRLLEQAGFGVLPLEGEGPSRLMITADGGAEDGDLAIRAELTSAESRLSLEGNGAIPSADPATGLFELEVTAADIEPFAMMFGLSLPQAGAGLPLSMKANIGMTDAQILASGIEGTAETNGFSGELEFDRSASAISGEGALRFDRADLGWLGELALGPEQFGTGGATWNDAAFLPPVPGQPEMRIALEAAEMSLGPAGTARDFSASLSTGTGAMALEQAEAQWFGGRLGGNVSVTNADGSVFLSGRISASDTDLEALERAIHGSSVLSGRASASVSLEGTGKSIRELVTSLAGGGELAAADLAVSGIDPGAFARILGAADREGFELEPGEVATMVTGFMTGGHMDAESLRLPFTLTGGVMRFSNAEIEDVQASLAGDARIDLTELRLEADWRLTFEPGVEAIAGGDPSLRFGVSGLLVDPAVSVDAGQLTNYLSMRAFERERRKVELLQAGVVEKQRLRREIALLKERAEIREAEARARAEAEEAARQAAEEAARLAEEEAQLMREAEVRRAAEAALEAEAAAARQAAEAEENARKAEEEAAARRAAEEAENARRAEEEAAAAAARLAEQLAAELAHREAEKARAAELKAAADREAAERQAAEERRKAEEAAELEAAAERERQAALEEARAAEAEAAEQANQDELAAAEAMEPVTSAETPKPEEPEPSASQDEAEEAEVTLQSNGEIPSMPNLTVPLAQTPLDRRVQWVRQRQDAQCFHVRVVSNTEDQMTLEGMGDKVEPFQILHDEFQSTFEFEPNVQVRLLSARQCPLPDFLTQIGFSGGSELALALDKDRIMSGDTLRGVLTGPSSAETIFYLIDSDGFGYRIDQFVTRTDNQAVFEIKLIETAERKADLRVILAISGNDALLETAPADVELVETLLPKLASAAEASGADIDLTYAFFNFASAQP